MSGDDDALGRARLALMIDRLGAGLAHDFNNVLTSIACRLEHPARPLEGAVELRHAVERGIRLTEGLQVAAGRASNECQGLDHFIADLAPALRRLVPDRIEVAPAPGREPTRVAADAWLLEQVLWHVVQRASEEAGPLPITISTERHDAPAAAHGSGGPCPLRARGVPCVAMRVERSPSRAAAPAPSTGVRGGGPLAVAHALAARVGGVVAPADRWPEDGVVIVHLPMVGGDLEEEGRTPDEVTAPVDVVVVEDDDDLRSLMRRLLQREGYAVAEAHAAEDALAQLRGHGAARLLVADLTLAGVMTGAELVRRATDARPDLRVLLISGHSVSDASQPFALVVPFLAKPFTPRMFVAKVRELLSSPAGPASSDPPPGSGPRR